MESNTMFYFSDPRCNFPKGRLQVQTEFPFYEPGNTVQGKIFIEVFQPLAASFIEMEIKGQEKAAFTRFWQEQDGEEFRERSERIKYKHKFAYVKIPVFQIAGEYGGWLNPGTYQVAFTFQLPPNMPSSMNFKDKRKRENPKAKCKYYVKTTLHTNDHSDKMKYKQVLMIREKPVEFRMNENQHEKSQISTWCCIDQGESTMWATYEKNIYTP